jgi:hypothetical protein
MSLGAEIPPEITWQEAIARLARERTVAETCAALLKKRGDPAAVDRGALAYGEAKAEYDGIIAGLIVALARRAEPITLPALQERLQCAIAKREAFCSNVRTDVPSLASGEKGVISEILEGTIKGAIGPLIDAVKTIWIRSRDDDTLMHKVIETQLEATAWRDFLAI